VLAFVHSAFGVSAFAVLMAQRRFHYEQAFEHYLRSNRIPYVAVDEAKKSLLPAGHAMRSIKSFDFVVYGTKRNLLVDVKGRMYGGGRREARSAPHPAPASGSISNSASSSSSSSSSGARYESWVTQDDVDSLAQWQELFGRDFTAVFVFLYCLRRQPPDALFEEVFEYGGRWYAPREAALDDYRREMTTRSGKWGTVHVPAAKFMKISREFRPQRDLVQANASIVGEARSARG
jgi:hypothetical protein